ncbi:MAG: N-acetylglucosamine-6-phosphate deacetylase [Victivallales bacterium]
MAKNRTLFLTDYCLTPHVHIPNAGILCEEKKIIAVGGASAFSLDEPGLHVIDLTDAYATPGFIDSHIHGGGGYDTAKALEPDADINILCRHLATHGITTFLPTLMSYPCDKMIALTAKLAELIEKSYEGADPCAINLEGPFINVRKCGSQNPEAICSIDMGYARELIAAGNGRVKLLTFAPELKGADKLIELLLENGVIPSMGHSIANPEEVLRAIDAGARRCTHLYNGLPPLHHRISSITDVVLTHNDIAVELIVDGAHIDPRMVDITARVKPNDKIIGISNAIEFENTDGSRYLKKEDGLVYTRSGVIAGTTMTLETGWAHLKNYSNMPGNLAAACFTSNPAQDLGLITRGEIRPGKRADITFFDLETNNVCMTVSNGSIVYKAPGKL